MTELITWNPNDKSSSTTLSNNNLTVKGYGLNIGIRTTEGKSFGKWYWECKVDVSGNEMIGIVDGVSVLGGYNNYTRLYAYNGLIYPGALPYGNHYTTNNIIGIALDLNNNTIEFFKDGVSQGIAFSNLGLLEKPIYPYVTNGGSMSSIAITANFGATEFAYPNVFKNLGSGWKSYDSNQINDTKKYLIQDLNNVIYTLDFDNNFIESPSQVVDEDNYLTNGFEKILDKEDIIKLKSLGNLNDIKLLAYTDNHKAKSLNLTANVSSKPSNQWLIDNKCKLLMWTDDIEKTEATMTYELKTPYKPIDILKKNNDGICNILMSKN